MTSISSFTVLKSPFHFRPPKKDEPGPPLNNFENHAIPLRRISVEEYYENLMKPDMLVVNMSLLSQIAEGESQPYQSIFKKCEPDDDDEGFTVSRVYPINKKLLNEILDTMKCDEATRGNILKYDIPFVLAEKNFMEIFSMDDYDKKLRQLYWAYIDWHINKV